MKEYDDLQAKWEGLKWRLIPKPGGAVTKPDDWYKLWAATQQIVEGDVPGDKPLWAKTGGLDFDGRDRWEAHKALKGQSTDEAGISVRGFNLQNYRLSFKTIEQVLFAVESMIDSWAAFFSP